MVAGGREILRREVRGVHEALPGRILQAAAAEEYQAADPGERQGFQQRARAARHQTVAAGDGDHDGVVPGDGLFDRGGIGGIHIAAAQGGDLVSAGGRFAGDGAAELASPAIGLVRRCEGPG